jgi:DNA polymerase
MGPQFKLMQNRGKLLQTPGPAGAGLRIERVVATIHPSAVLRAPDSEGRRAAYESLIGDLKVVARALRCA